MEGPEAHHLLTVLRAHPGDTVRLFDGCGRSGVFLFQRRERKKAFLALLSEQILPCPDREIFLALGWNKTARRGWLLEKAVELNAAGLVFWQAERSQGRVPETPKESWATQLVAAAKQCGNPRLPSLATAPGGAGELTGLFAANELKMLLWENASGDTLFNPASLPESGRTIIVLGPEGGLTDDEVQLFTQGGFRPLSLGQSILRWETAALLCLGLCYWDSQRRDPLSSTIKPV